MTFWCYILQRADGRFYTAHTDNLERRFPQHLTGGYSDFTSRRLPAVLVWSQEFPTRRGVLEAKRVVGRRSRAKKEAMIRGDWKTVSFVARTRGERFPTSLETNEEGRASFPQHALVSSEVEKRGASDTSE